ncbi:ribulose-phosphate 3-epimerase [Candidatus Woesearchaeota archaeon]|nr:ribulose-phosphate 3-epimerase [Candidatus Woesearchaeota archaeon]
MAKDLLVSASILAAPHATQEEVQAAASAAEAAGADLLHVDVMDGTFVPETTRWNDPAAIKAIATGLPLDIHIMIQDPDDRLEEFVSAGASMLAFHVEAAKEPERLLSRLRRAGVKAGIVLNPETPAEKILPYLSLADYALVLSVHPGKAGQEFLPDTLTKVIIIKQRFPELPIEMDGGMNPETAALAREAGASIIVAGNAIYASEDLGIAIRSLRETQKTI